MATSGSTQSISAMDPTISAPTMMSAGAVAALGIGPTSGATNSAPKKHSPVTIAGMPVLPPAATPADDSIYEQTVLVPVSEPATVAVASAKKMRESRGILPLGP